MDRALPPFGSSPLQRTKLRKYRSGWGQYGGTLEYLKRQKDIRLIPEPDKGMYHALNKGMATARGRILGHLNADEQYDRSGLAHALQKLDQTRVDAVFRPINADWHMPVQTCSFFFRRGIWKRVPYPAEYRVVGDHAWFRRQMKLGLKLVSACKPIGLFPMASGRHCLTPRLPRQKCFD